MMFMKKMPERPKHGRKGKKKKQADKHVWPETISPTAGIRADTWDSRFADPVLVNFYDKERR